MSFLNTLYQLPGLVKRLLTPNKNKRSREEAIENIEVESLHNSKRQATTTRFFEEPKQGVVTLQSQLQSHPLVPTNVNYNTISATPIALPKEIFKWEKFEAHSTQRPRHNRGGAIAMSKKSLLAPARAEEDAKELEVFKVGIEAHRILEAQRYRASELPSRAFSNAQNNPLAAPPPAAAAAAAVPVNFKSQQAAPEAKKPQLVDKFDEIMFRYTGVDRSTFAARGVADSLHFPGVAGVDGGVKEANLANEKYNDRLLAWKTSMEIAKKAVEGSKFALEKEKKSELELKEVSNDGIDGTAFFFFFFFLQPRLLFWG
jgi:hypothetical protein